MPRHQNVRTSSDSDDSSFDSPMGQPYSALEVLDGEERPLKGYGRRLDRFVQLATLPRILALFVSVTLLYFSYAFYKAFQQRPSLHNGSKVPRFLMLGDSITQYSFRPEGGTGAALADTYQRRADVVLRGFSGWPSEAGRFVLPELLEAIRPDIMTVWFGSNDAAIPVPASIYPSVPLDRYVENLHAMIDLIPVDVCVLLVTPPALSENGQKAHYIEQGYPPDFVARRNNSGMAAYAKACLGVGQEVKRSGRRRFEVVETHDLMLQEALRVGNGDRDVGLARFLGDGLHPNGEGYKLITPAIMAAIDAACPDMSASQLPVQWPQSWPDDFDFSNR